ncbi:replication-relaxation family protein [Streptomyces mirabilis]|uniref:replication-relaxation family protein n=1 Tax=Streptomyces mirabilis TaxID=68239 RepID=UPI0036CBA6C3
MKGTGKNPAIDSARADVVVIAPDDDVPLVFFEVDNCTEEAVLIAAKFDKYAWFFKRKEKDTYGIEICERRNDSETQFLGGLVRS